MLGRSDEFKTGAEADNFINNVANKYNSYIF